MIHLMTGLPGHGKTLYTLDMVKKRVDQENKELIAKGEEPRRVFYHGIPELTFDWEEFEKPEMWYCLPTGSIIIIDEAQKTFRPRGNAAAVPPHVQHLETHRHDGHDLYIITQHPLLVDGNLRRLVDRHFHVHRPFGWSNCTVLEFQGVKDQPMQKSNLVDAQKSLFVYPKELYGVYKSAQLHTAKKRLPKSFIVLLIAPILVGALGYYAYSKLKSHTEVPNASASAPAGFKPDAMPRNRPADNKEPKMTRDEWIETFNPRITGLAYTAPRYDEVTKPTKAPFPDACIQSAKTGCKCYTKQATVLDVSKELCQQIVERGFYRDFEDPENSRIQPAMAPATSAAAAPTGASAAPEQIAMLGGTPPKSLDSRYGTYATNSATTGAAATREGDASTVGRNTAVALNR